MNEYIGKQTNRVAEMILGILGSIFGIIGGLFAIMVDGIGKEFGATDSGSITGLGVAVIITCIITLVLSCIINKKSLNRNIINHRWYFKYNFISFLVFYQVY